MNMREVPAEEFFKKIGSLDVHPRSEKDASFWETRNRLLIGVSKPGYLCRDAAGKYTAERTYFLVNGF